MRYGNIRQRVLKVLFVFLGGICMKRLTDNVYYTSHNADTDRPVIGLVNGSRHSLMIDAGNSPHHAREILQAVEHLGVNNAKYLAVTHWHWDHVFGIHYMNLLTICHQLTNEKLKRMQQLEWDDASLDKRVAAGEEIEFCSTMMKKEMPSREGLIIGAGEITFDSKLEIDLGGISCIIDNVGGDHGADASIVYIPSEKVMFLGDCLSPDLYSGLRSYSDKALEMLRRIMQYDAEIYIAAHDEPFGKGEMHQFFQELMRVEKTTRGVMNSEEAVERFRQEYRREPNEDEAETIQYFINGNMKK